MTRKDQTYRRILAVLLVMAVLVLCAGDLAHAMPRDNVAMDCGARLCAGATGCSATTGLQTVAVAPLPEVPSIAAPVARTVGADVVASGAAPDRSVHALPPPLASARLGVSRFALTTAPCVRGQPRAAGGPLRHGPTLSEPAESTTKGGESMTSPARVMLLVVLAVMLGPPGWLSRPAAPAAANAAAGDPDRGATLFRQCAACHAVEPGVHLTGPSLASIWGRRAGTVDGFGRYSPALKHAGITWDAATLDRWLERPEKVVPDNTMTFPGVADARQRADLIAYLKAVAEGQAPSTPGAGMMAARPKSDLKQVAKERRVTSIRYCGDGYHVTTEAGRTIPFWEFNLRFKTDSSRLGPERGKPILVPAGMQGDRAQVVFSGLDDLKRFLVERCEGDR